MARWLGHAILFHTRFRKELTINPHITFWNLLLDSLHSFANKDFLAKRCWFHVVVSLCQTAVVNNIYSIYLKTFLKTNNIPNKRFLRDLVLAWFSLSKPQLWNSRMSFCLSPDFHSCSNSFGTLKVPSAFGLNNRSTRFLTLDNDSACVTLVADRVSSGCEAWASFVSVSPLKESWRITGGGVWSGSVGLVLYGSSCTGIMDHSQDHKCVFECRDSIFHYRSYSHYPWPMFEISTIRHMINRLVT